MPDESKIIISALATSIAWYIGSMTSTRLSKTNCKSGKKSCLKRVILEASGTFLKPQKSRRGLEYSRNTSNNWSVGIVNIFWIIKAYKKAVRRYVRVRPVAA